MEQDAATALELFYCRLLDTRPGDPKFAHFHTPFLMAMLMFEAEPEGMHAWLQAWKNQCNPKVPDETVRVMSKDNVDLFMKVWNFCKESIT